MDYFSLAVSLLAATAPILGGLTLQQLKAHNVNTTYYEALGRAGSVALQALVDSKTPVTMASATAAAESAGVDYLKSTAGAATVAKAASNSQLVSAIAAAAVQQAIAGAGPVATLAANVVATAVADATKPQ